MDKLPDPREEVCGRETMAPVRQKKSNKPASRPGNTVNPTTMGTIIKERIGGVVEKNKTGFSERLGAIPV